MEKHPILQDLINDDMKGFLYFEKDTESIDFCLLATTLHDLSIDEQDGTLKENVRILLK